MKKGIILLTMAMAMYSCSQPKPAADVSETQSTSVEGTTYGAAVSEENVIPANKLTSEVAGRDSIQATVAAEMVESCQAKGCWMDVKLADNNTMKVTFRDYGFFLPVEELKGRQVIFTGTALHQQVSVEDQRHYAKDAGKSAAEIAAITEPKEELRFIADGVILK